MTTSFQSEIRDSTLNQLIEKVARNNYNKYLKRIRLERLRMFETQNIDFDFPVTALIGPNGGGKTTILGACGCIYKAIKPNQFFAKSGILDSAMQNWKMEYTLIDKSIKRDDTLRRSASYKQSRWKRGAVDRECVFFGISRTVPANERIELRKCASPTFYTDTDSSRIIELDANVKNSVGRILGKDISGYSSIKTSPRRDTTLLKGQTQDFSYSEFHFGAGESSVIRISMAIEALPENSILLVEEIENGLHPIATIRMVEYLIDVAFRKKSQVIFTTHSNDALQPLPDCAIWACINGTLIQGKLDINSLRAITGQIETKLAIFVEDDFAKNWIEVALRNINDVAVDGISVYSMHGDGTAVKTNLYHNGNPTCKFPSICLIDGDSRQTEDHDANTFRLPGESPETYIYDKVLDIIGECKAELSVALHRKYDDQDIVEKVVKDTRRTSHDHHLLFSIVGKQLGFITQEIVRNAFIYVWSIRYPEEVETIIEGFRHIIPLNQ